MFTTEAQRTQRKNEKLDVAGVDSFFIPGT
jgi:hypothetical protein